MKKIFWSAVLILSIFCSTASARDIYVASKDGCDYYVVSESVKRRELTHQSESGKIFHGSEVTGNVKKIRDGELISLRNWKFVAFVGHAVVYSVDGLKCGSFNSSSPETLHAMKILHVMNSCIGRR